MAEINPEHREIMEKWYEAVEGMTHSLNNMGPLAAEEKRLEEATKKTKDRLSQFGDTVVSVSRHTKDFGKTFFDATEGTAKYGKAVGGVTDALGGFLGSFGLLGKVVGGLVKVFGGVIQAGLEQNEQLIKGYQALSEFGGIDTRGVMGVFDDLKNAGLTVKEFEKLNRTLSKVRPDLAAIGGDVAKGTRQITETLSGILGTDLERDLRSLGYTTETISDNVAMTMAREARLGLLQTKNQDQITRQTVLYLKELQELTALTGLSREEAQQKRDQLLADVRFNDTMEKLRAEKGEAAYERVMNAMLVAEELYGPKFATGLKDIFRTGSLGASEFAAKVGMMTQGAVFPFIDALKNGSSELYGRNGAFAKLGAAGEKVYQGFETSAQFSNEFFNDMMMDGKMVFGFRRSQFLKTTDAEKLITAQRQKGDKDRLNLDMEVSMNERKLRLMANEMLFKASQGLVEVFSKLVTVATSFGKVMAKIVDVFSDKFGSFIGMQKTNLTAYFLDNLSDINEELAKQQGKLPEILSEREKIEKEITEVQAKKLRAEEEVAKSTTFIGKEIARARFGDPLGHQDRIDKLTKQLQENKDSEKALRDSIDALKESQARKTEEGKQQTTTSRARTMAAQREAEAAGNQSPAETARLGMRDTANLTATTASKILDFVGQYESRGDYNVMVGGKKENLTQMTVGQVLDLQKDLISKGQNTAAGKYQIKNSTLKELVGRLGIGLDEKFDQSLQDRLGQALLDQIGFNKFKTGQITPDQFADNLAGIWAALPMRNGQSRYANVGNNAAGVDRASVMAMLEGAASGGVFSGPSGGYPVMLHGNEIVIPMKDFQSALGVQSVTKEALPTTMTPTGSTTTADTSMVDAFRMLSNKFDEMVDQMRVSNRTQEEILQYARM